MSAIHLKTDSNFDPSDGAVTPILVGVADACTMLGIRKSKLYELVYAGRLTKVKCGGKALITVASISQFVEELVTGAR